MFDVTGAMARFEKDEHDSTIYFDGNYLTPEIVNCINQAFHAVEYFCEQVECGNFRSIFTYHNFNDILLRSGWRKDDSLNS